MSDQDRVIEAFNQMVELKQEAREFGDDTFGLISQYTETVKFLKSYEPVGENENQIDAGMAAKVEMAERIVEMAEMALDSLKD